MLGIGSALNLFTELYKNNVFTNSDETQRRIAKLKTGLISTDGTLTKLLSKYTVEPILIATEGVSRIDNKLYDRVCQINTDIFASYYCQAFKIIADHYGASTAQTVKLLATDNVSVMDIAKGYLLGVETMDAKDYLKALLSENKYLRVGNENDRPREVNAKLESPIEDIDKDPLYGILNRSVELSVYEPSSKNTVSVNIQIKAMLVNLTIDRLLNFLQPTASDKKFWDRVDEWRAGAISFMDLLFAGDLIKKYKQNKLKDTDGLLSTINERNLSANVRQFGKGDGIKGYQANYNMLIITADDKIRLDNHIGGDITKENFKQQLLEEASALCLTIVDPDYERVTFFTRDIRGSSSAGFKTILKRKGGSYELDDLFKSLLLSKPMSF